MPAIPPVGTPHINPPAPVDAIALDGANKEKFIDYNAKPFQGSSVYYAQRAENAEQAETTYFNQPVRHYPISSPATYGEKEELKTISKNMLNEIEATGVGLAHNQFLPHNNAKNAYAIFVINGKNFAAIATKEFESKTCVNPIIVGFDAVKVDALHRCLSARAADYARMATYKTILIAFFSEEGELQVEKFTGFEAVVAQHEFNHLSTSATYVDAVNHAIKGDRYVQADSAYIDENAAKELSKDGYILEHKEGTPGLTSIETLARCNKFLDSNQQYTDAVDAYLRDNPDDRWLYENLKAIPTDQTRPTYYHKNCYPNV